MQDQQQRQQEQIHQYRQAGWAIIPIPYGHKRPDRAEWNNWEPNSQDFQNEHLMNLGLRLDTAPLHIVDVDLDVIEAVKAGWRLLPHTPARFGRRSKPSSHHLYSLAQEGGMIRAALAGAPLTRMEEESGQGLPPGEYTRNSTGDLAPPPMHVARPHGQEDNSGEFSNGGSSPISDQDQKASKELNGGSSPLPRSNPTASFGVSRRVVRWFDPFRDKNGKTSILLEIRGPDHQTIIPPSFHPNGEVIEWNPNATDQGFPPMPTPIRFADLEAYCDEIAAVALLARHWGDSSRHEAALALAGGLARAEWREDDILNVVQLVCEIAGDEDEVATLDRTRAVQDTIRKQREGQATTGWTRLSEIIGQDIVRYVRKWLHITPKHDQLALSERGNATRFLNLHGQDLRYNNDLDRWLVWGEHSDGKYWEPQKKNAAAVIQLAADLPRAILMEVPLLTDPKQQHNTVNFARQSDNLAPTRAMLTIAATHRDILVNHLDVDQNPYLINCANGTYDLEHDIFRESSREDLITRVMNVSYDPRADTTRWEKFLTEITQGDEDLIAYLQRCAGYSLTGETHEEILFVIVGPGGTGKTTFLEAIRGVMGSYARTANPETFLAGRGQGSGAASPDLARLVNARLVATSEMDEGRRVAAATIKRLTGGDTITVRPLYGEEFEYKPQFKLWITANDLPLIPSHDTGAWRRVKVIPFLYEVPVPDVTLKRLFTLDPDQRSAVLKWMIEGYRMFMRGGALLGEPPIVKQTTKEHRGDMDNTDDFFSECCLRGDKMRERGSLLREAYSAWCRRQGVDELNIVAWGRALRAAGFEKVRYPQGNVWKGIQLLPAGNRLTPLMADLDDDQQDGHEDGRIITERN